MIAPTAILFFLYALRDAAREGNLVKVRDLVNDGALVSANHLVDRYSPLHAAANQGHLQVVDYLVGTAHANVHATEKYEESTPLHEACQRGHLAVAKYLVEQAHADAYYKDKRLRNALHKAAAAGHLPVVQFLVSQTSGALVNDRDQDFKTPLHEACSAGHLPVVMFLVQQARARVHDISITGDTALHYAVQYGHVQVAKFLWQDANARLDVRNGDGKTPVDCAQMAITYANEHEMRPLLQQWTMGAAAAPPNKSSEPAVPQQPPNPPQNVVGIHDWSQQQQWLKCFTVRRCRNFRPLPFFPLLVHFDHIGSSQHTITGTGSSKRGIFGTYCMRNVTSCLFCFDTSLTRERLFNNCFYLFLARRPRVITNPKISW